MDVVLGVYLTFWLTVIFAAVGEGSMTVKEGLHSAVVVLVPAALGYFAGMDCSNVLGD